MNPASRTFFASDRVPLELRFSIGSSMQAMATLAVLVCYLKAYANDDWIRAMQLVCGIALVAAMVGYGLPESRGDARFAKAVEIALWAALGAMTALLCAVGEPLAHQAFNLGWAIVGGSTAAMAVLMHRRSLWLRMCVGAAVGFGVLASFGVVAWYVGGMHAWMEVACGPLAGAVLAGVVCVLEEIRIMRGYTRSTMIFTLTLGVIAGNIFGRSLGFI